MGNDEREVRLTADSATPGRLGIGFAELLLMGLLAAFLFESWSIPAQYDDSYISYRYASHLVQGHGLVYNIGEYVEGFSNLLWTLLVAAGLALGFEAKAVGHALGLSSGCLAMVATYIYATAGLRPSQRPWAAVAVALVYASPVFARWSTAGMETPLFVAAVVGALAADAHGRDGQATTYATLATLTRPEGALVAAAIFGFRLLRLGFGAPSAWRGPLGYGAVMIGLTAFRVAYYGDPLPNTFYAKVGGVSLGVSAAGAAFFLIGNSGLCALPAAFMLRHPRWIPGACYVAAMLAYGVSIGSGQRYLMSLIPCFAVLGVCGVAAAFDRKATVGAASTVAVALSFYWSFFGLGGGEHATIREAIAKAPRIRGVARERDEDAKNERLGERRAAVLRERDEPIALVATGAIGSFGFHSELPILDILGLVDPTIARSKRPAGDERFALPGHQRSDPDYVFSRKPDYLLIGRRGRQRLGNIVTAPDELRAHPDLDRYYEWDAEVFGYKRIR
jgi:arabinofuranosyltransferase